jgi:hypothetical protein
MHIPARVDDGPADADPQSARTESRKNSRAVFAAQKHGLV